MSLNIDKSKLTIMGVQFDSQKDFKGVWYALSTNMIEGWEPEKHDVEEMKQYIVKKIKSNAMDELPVYHMYYYVDPDNEYTYPDTSVLKNKLNIANFDELTEKEYQLVKIKALDLFLSPIMVHSMEVVCKIHHKLFSELYIWAGNYRKVNISKQGKAFMAMQPFGTGEQYMDSLIDEYHNNAQTKEQIVNQLATILDNLNYMHPFREGNGRTQREVIRVLALAKGYEVLMTVDGQDDVYKQYMDGTVYSDVTLLESLIRSLMEKIVE